MVEVKRGRGRPRKEPVGVFSFERTKRPVGRPPKKKAGRPKGSTNKPKDRTIEQRVQTLELSMIVVVEALGILAKEHMRKKAR